MCSVDPASERRWRVRNTNSFGVAYTWSVYGTGLSGAGIASSGDSYFHTPTAAGSNTVIIRWQNENGSWKQTTKASSGAACSSARRRATDSALGMQLFPNPVANVLEIRFNQPVDDSYADFRITDLYGKLIYQAQLELTSAAFTRLSIEALALPQGIYILEAKTGQNWYQEKFVKQ